MTTCAHCESTFTPRRKDQTFCQRKCKEAAKARRTKQQRLERDRQRLGVDPKNYRKLDPDSVAAKYGLTAKEEVCDPWDF